jgi:hypothetical protein
MDTNTDAVLDAAPGAATGAAPGAATEQQSDARTFSIASFVLGIASIVFGWTLVAPVTGLILGVIALRRGTSERALATWGVCLNGAMLALAALAIIALVILLGFGLLALPFAV